ncbi:uncharacterized protein J4E78_009515 [Alternaria triticimaculans]|uniref:uncharacterized protein n=1 Tax=Alternaria triticimaculans TaxID=297637 RepID=UPI0020C1CAAD|nr:uncharacterized protein J4E78_009515 [Alternaria triticimaculans]KAI4644696.1 hypothetical protein J4E78_009515 [Alternaria triticimaculans]
MAPRNRLDAPAAALNPERSDDEVFLDRFADNPLGGTKLYEFFLSWPANDYFPSRQEVERIAQHQVDTIFGAFDRVRYILERHEDTIRKRWTKKSTSKKRKLLLAAQPNMPNEHRPDMDADNAVIFSFPPGQGVMDFATSMAIAKNSEACMVPFLNMEDLLQPGTFLTLLSSRGHNPIASFSQTELLHAPLARWLEETLQSHLQTYTMLLAGRDTRDTYGRLKFWRSKSEAHQSIHKGRSVYPGHGLQILGIQKILYTFLQRCCFLLVGDLLSSEKARLDQYPVIRRPTSLFNAATDHKNRAEVSLMTPYGVPAQLSFGRLRCLISSKVGELEDHIWALREDPGYFSEVFNDYKSHRTEYIVSMDGNVNAIMKEQPHAIFALILRELITDPYYELSYWHECLRLLDRLTSTALRHGFQFDSNKELPEDYRKDILRLWSTLNAIHMDVHECFRQRVPATPGMRPYFVKAKADPNNGGCGFIIARSKAAGDPVTLRFLNVLTRITNARNPPKEAFVAELDDLERLVIKHPAAKDLLSPFVWADFSQLSVSSECIQQIRSYQPWSTQIEYEMDSRMHELSLEFRHFTEVWGPVSGMRRFDDVKLARMADPADGKFHYPITERRSRTITDTLRLAEKNLDAFWKTADAFCKRLAGASFPDILKRDITRGRSIRRTAAWTEPTTHRDERPQPQSIYKALPSESRSGDEDIRSLAKIKKKIKTRGTCGPASLADIQEPESFERLDSPPPQVTVDKRSHLVFKTLFFSPSARDVPGEVSWKDFVHAMVQRGFEAEKLHGSAWRFTPALNTERAIQFHAPHGALSKLPLTWARRYGRRLEREYGWTGEMFTLA